MSEETANEKALEEETAPVETPEEPTASAEAPESEAAPEPESVEAEPEPVEAAAEPEVEAAPAAEPAEAAAQPEVAEAAAEPEVAAEGDSGVRFDKLKKAEEILRASAPHYSREAVEETFEKVVHINRCSKVVKGGRRFSFSALVVSGDRDGRVGFGFGKAQEVSECIKKASEASKKDMVAVNITENTIPHPVIGEHGGGRVMLRPASPGTGLIAGGGVRAVVEAAGVKDVLAKSMGSNNPANVVKATMDALAQLRSKEEIYSLRGKRLAEKRAL